MEKNEEGIRQHLILLNSFWCYLTFSWSLHHGLENKPRNWKRFNYFGQWNFLHFSYNLYLQAIAFLS